MVRRSVIRAVVIVGATCAAGALVTTQTQTLLITHVNAVSVADGRLLQDRTVTISGNPLVDITNVGRIRAVVLGGRLLERADLDKLLAHVRIAAQQ